MKLSPGKNRVLFIVSLIFVVHSDQANAACSRDDVTFYLDKGFTTDQISGMCSEPSVSVSEPAQPDASTERKAGAQNAGQYSAPSAVDKNALFLSRAIKAKDIKLSSDSLRYTLKNCIEYGEEDLFGFTPKVCPDVIYIISLKGLEVTDTGKRYGFYGTPEVRIKSTVKREIIGHLEDMKPYERELILKAFEKGDATAIPIRDDFSLDKVQQVLQEISI
jgi:hypothetical protein